jgi:pimeloyl-ACP methyl ester carboxylesterase
MKTQLLSGLKIHFYDNNRDSDEAIVFIHGNSHSLNTFHKQYADTNLNSFRLIGLDLPGHGRSEHSTSYDLKLLANSVKGLVDFLELKKVIIIGHSLGGHVAIECLDEVGPEGILIFGTPPLTHPLNLDGFRANDKMGLLSKNELQADEIVDLLKEYYEDHILSLDDIEEFKMTDLKFRSSILNSFLSLSFKDEIKALNRYKGNKAIIHGAKDKLINSNYLEKNINTDELWKEAVIYIDSSHNLHIEKALELNNLIYSFAEETFFKANSNTNQQQIDTPVYL